jgi:hypothetical protein
MLISKSFDTTMGIEWDWGHIGVSFSASVNFTAGANIYIQLGFLQLWFGLIFMQTLLPEQPDATGPVSTPDKTTGNNTVPAEIE